MGRFLLAGSQQFVLTKHLTRLRAALPCSNCGPVCYLTGIASREHLLMGRWQEHCLSSN